MFIPLTINSKAIQPITKGYHRLSCALILRERLLPNSQTAESMGNVPSPKKTMNKLPFNGSCAAAAPAHATYTNPHGRMPFNIPPIIFADEDFEWTVLEKPVLKVPKIASFDTVLSIPGNNLSMSRASKMEVPVANEMFCWIPNILTELPTHPNKAPHIAYMPILPAW